MTVSSRGWCPGPDDGSRAETKSRLHRIMRSAIVAPVAVPTTPRGPHRHDESSFVFIMQGGESVVTSSCPHSGSVPLHSPFAPVES